MASCMTEQFGGSSCPQVQLTVTESSSTGNTSTLSWVLQYIAKSPAQTSYNKAYTAVIDGETVAEGKFSINGKTGTHTIASGTKTIYKQTSARSISFSCSMAFNLTWSGVYGGTKTGSSSIAVAGITTHTVSYNANGGTGAPGSQTKWYGTILTLSSVRPTRTGYSFLGWGTSAGDTSVDYAPGSQYGADANITLYAIWKADTYTVSYNANGGTGAPGKQTKTYGVTLKLSTTVPKRTNYTFKGWGTSASSTTVAYAAGANYTSNAPITLYAIWELAYTAPRITEFSVDRCNSSGTLSESGTYALVKFKWATDKTVSSIKIEHKVSTSSTWTTTTVTGSGTSGTVSKVIGGGGLSTENEYNIRVTVADSMGSNNVTKNIAPMAYDLDFLSGGGGVAIGKPASKKGLEVAYAADFNSTVNIDGTATMNGAANIKGTATFSGVMKDRFSKDIGNGMAIYNRTPEINPNTTLDHQILTKHANCPNTSNYWYITTFFYSSKAAANPRAQIAIPYDFNGSMFNRYYNGSSWGAWQKSIRTSDLGAYIESTGTSGVWQYRKYSDGWFECWTTTWYRYDVNAYVDNAWGSLFESDVFNPPALPFKTMVPPNVIYTYVGADPGTQYEADVWIGHTPADHPTTTLPTFNFKRPAAATIGHPSMMFWVRGRFR